MYCINPQSDEPIFLIDCQIGKDESNPDRKYIDGAEFVRELLYMDGEGKKRIQVWINSGGGLVSEGMAIYAAILKTKTKVDTYCMGQAFSIAGCIFQAGRKRVMLENALLMYHQAYSANGETDRGLDAINGAIAVMISSRSWKDVDGVKKMMQRTTYISSQEAFDSGLCDEVEMVADLNKPRMNNDDADLFWQESNEFVNKLLPNKEPQMNKAEICKLLGLDPIVSDEVAMSALTVHLNKAKEIQSGKAITRVDEDTDEIKNLKDALAKAVSAKAAADEALNSVNTAVATAKAEEEKSAKRSAAKAKILEVINARKLTISDKAVENYVNFASDDAGLASVIETIELIPTTIVAAKPIVLQNKKNDPEFAVDATGNITDTERMAAHMNAQVRNSASNRFTGKEK